MTEVVPQALLPVFFVLILGYTAGKFHVINAAHVGALNSLLINYALPASLFIATSSTSRDVMLAQWPIFVIVGGAMMAVYAGWYWAGRLFSKQTTGVNALHALTVSLPNAAALGLPVTSALFGAGHAAPVAVVVMLGSLLPAPVTLIILEVSRASDSKTSGDGRGIARALLRTFGKPVVLAPIAGMTLSLLAWRLPPLAANMLQPIGAGAGGLALFVTGLILSGQSFGLSWETVAATITANIMRPLIALAIAKFLAVPAPEVKLAVLFASFPSGFYGILFGATYSLETKEVGSTVIASTISAAVTVSFAIAWLYG
ncbi:MAG: AEC family transporter [Sphingomonadales bacterium]|nr:AEC family transporter [Sphingomonadales bacterium]MDE2172109.1 AEC family transporter [Sphingomonadales bacterium]